MPSLPSPAKVLQTVAESAGTSRARTLVAPGNIVGSAAVTGPPSGVVVKGGASSSAWCPSRRSSRVHGEQRRVAGAHARDLPADLSARLRLKPKGGDGMRFKFYSATTRTGTAWVVRQQGGHGREDSLRVPQPTQYARDAAAGGPPLLRRGLRDDPAATLSS